jgi:hypothetical protein
MKTQHRWRVCAAVTAANLRMLGIGLQAVPQRILDQLSRGRSIGVDGELSLADGRLLFYATDSRKALGAGMARCKLDLWSPSSRVLEGPSGWTYQDIKLVDRDVSVTVRLSKGDAKALIAAMAALRAAASQGAPRR